MSVATLIPKPLTLEPAQICPVCHDPLSKPIAAVAPMSDAGSARKNAVSFRPLSLVFRLLQREQRQKLKRQIGGQDCGDVAVIVWRRDFDQIEADQLQPLQPPYEL